MKYITLETIDSTNDFLKDLKRNNDIENYTVVVANNQYDGKGQRGNSWETESNKNLTFSMFIDNFSLATTSPFLLNNIISVSIVEVLKTYNIPKIQIKWPNDILIGNKKIAGILIENSWQNNHSFFSIIGIGLNVNQCIFENLPKASSLALVLKKELDKTILLKKICNKIKENITFCTTKNSYSFIENYHSYLFKKGIPSVFINTATNEPFQGIIQGVTNFGELKILLENETVALFKNKEIVFYY